jgi:hypothetical protein
MYCHINTISFFVCTSIIITLESDEDDTFTDRKLVPFHTFQLFSGRQGMLEFESIGRMEFIRYLKHSGGGRKTTDGKYGRLMRWHRVFMRRPGSMERGPDGTDVLTKKTKKMNRNAFIHELFKKFEAMRNEQVEIEYWFDNKERKCGYCFNPVCMLFDSSKW